MIDEPNLDDLVPCTWCFGLGGLEKFAHIDDGICFRCKGAGQVTYRFALKARPRRPLAARWWDVDYVAEVRAMVAFARRYGDQAFERLERLRDRDYEQFRGLLDDLGTGRHEQVAEALSVRLSGSDLEA